jgi:Type IV pilin-like G and H, putative
MYLYKLLGISLSITWLIAPQISYSQTQSDANIMAMQRNAQQIVMGMNRAQQAYYIENNRFTNEFKALAIGTNDAIANSYQIRVFLHPQRNAVMQAAIPSNNGYKSYIGLVRTHNFTVQNRKETTTLATLCESMEAKAQLPTWVSYKIPTNDNPACPPGFRVSMGGNQTISTIEKKSPQEQASSKMLAMANEQVKFYEKNNRFKKDWEDIPRETDAYLYRSFIHPGGKITMAAAITKDPNFKSYISLVHQLKPQGKKANLVAIHCVSKENQAILSKWSDIQFSEEKPVTCPNGFEIFPTKLEKK